MMANVFERHIIGALMIDRSCATDVQNAIRPEHFRNELCRAAYEDLIERYNSMRPVDVSIVQADLLKSGHKEATEFLLGCMTEVPTAANVLEYCRLLKEDYESNRLFQISEKMAADLVDSVKPSDVLADVLPKLQEAAEQGQEVIHSSMDVSGEFLEYYYKTKEDPGAALVPTNIKVLDTALGGGLYRSALIIIAGRPGMGKSTVAINIAESIASRGVPLLFVSLEMSRIQVMAKRVARMTGFCYTNLMNGSISDGCNDKVCSTLEILAEYPFEVTDDTGVKVSEIEARARSVKGLGCVFVDYLGLLGCEETDIKKTRYEQVSNLSWALKKMAKRLNVPVVVLCQLNRESVKQKADKRPSLTDLRDSGAIEQDADVVILLHRPNYYKELACSTEQLQVIIAKNRHAATDTIVLQWTGSSGTVAEDYWENDRFHHREENEEDEYNDR